MIYCKGLTLYKMKNNIINVLENMAYKQNKMKPVYV